MNIPSLNKSLPGLKLELPLYLDITANKPLERTLLKQNAPPGTIRRVAAIRMVIGR